jgi:uncharacterized protein
MLGAKILLDEGFDPRISQIVETHLLLGLTKDEILHPAGRAWPLPARDYEPQSVEAELLCYADRFHSKGPSVFNSFNVFMLHWKKSSQAKLQSLRQWLNASAFQTYRRLPKNTAIR